MSAQRLSALFPLRTFYSVANLKFNCLAWHVYLNFRFDKNIYGNGFSIFFVTPRKFFFEKRISIEKPPTHPPFCLHTPLVSFLFDSPSAAFEKIYEGKF